MAKRKISNDAVLEMVNQGQSLAEVGRYFGVSKVAIHKRLGKVRGRTTKVLIAKEAEKSVQKGFDAMGQLMEINGKSLKLLDDAEKDKGFSLRCIGELRKQVKLAFDIYQTLYSQQAAQEFMNLVLDILKEVDPDVRKKVIQRINAEQSLRNTLRLN